MKKTWVFFKLRMRQLKSDKTGLFFAYVFPVLLLLGIGYPLEMMSDTRIRLAYVDHARDARSEALLAHLKANKMVRLISLHDSVPGGGTAVREALTANEIGHVLEIDAGTDSAGWLKLSSNSLAENAVGALALQGLLRDYPGERIVKVGVETVPVGARASYLAVLLPGIIGMTLLIIGLGGFGAVLIEEEHQGLYRNLKTIDVSPASFLSGLFLSRMVVAYSVAIALLGISALVFDLPVATNIPLLLMVITLGSITFLGLGLMISSFSPSVTAFNGIVNFVQLPLVIFGGVFFSINAFPLWLRNFAEMLPLTQFNSALRDLIFGSVGFHNISELYPELTVLALWSLALLLLARLKFKW